jgi:PAS domain S-box-containing protein
MDLKIKSRYENTPAKLIESGTVRFDLFFKAFPRPIYIWQCRNGEVNLVDYNDTGGTYLQDVADALSPQGAGSSVPAGEGAVADIKRCNQEKSRFIREIPGYHVVSTGEVKDLVVTYAFVEPDFVMMMVKDVTDERAVLNQLQRLSSAVEQTADAVFITNRDGVIEYVNPAFEQVTGYARDEVLGKTPRILKSGEMRPGYYQTLWKTILGGNAFQGQTINHRRDGSKLIVEQTITPMKDQSGQITHFVSLLKDVTERIHFQEKETEHRLAGKIQQGLFPKRSPKIEGYDIAGAVFPASNTSGDCFDFIPMMDGTIGIVVGDVCGHGMGSALLMASARAYLRSITTYVSDPKTVLEKLNNQIYGDLADIGFITVSLARLDPKKHRLEYANAGNWPVYILDEQGDLTHEIRTGGYPIGITPRLDLRPCEPLPLAPGSIAVFMTDGIPEAADTTGTAFGVARMLALIQIHRAAPAKEIIQRVRDEVVNYLGTIDHDDDQTLVICKRVS